MIRSTTNPEWELVILDALPEAQSLGGLAVGDIDGDGHTEMVVGGNGGLLWYRPATGEKGRIAEGRFAVGLTAADLDGDGRPEVYSGAAHDGQQILGFRYTGDGDASWESFTVDGECTASVHDLMACDVDGDGRLELIATACYGTGDANRTCIYRRPDSPGQPWPKHLVGEGVFAEGTSAGGLLGDGRVHIITGPYWYTPPKDGPYVGRWERRVVLPGFREMCRTAMVDVTGNGRLDIVAVESEYPDGRLSWFENRIPDDPENPWVERRIDPGSAFNFAHSLHAWSDPDSGEAHFMLAEMAEGGWNAPRNRDARVLHYRSADGGTSWDRELISRGTGTHEAFMADVNGDGLTEVAGKEWLHPKVHYWRRLPKDHNPIRFRHVLLDRDKPYTATDIIASDVDGDGRADVVCGAWWYRNPDWERRAIPGIYQVHYACDIDGDGRDEFICTKRREGEADGYGALCSVACWLKPVDPLAGKWEEHPIGTGHGDWPHGILVAPILPGGGLALVFGYHNARRGFRPELFEIPEDPASGPWPKRILAEIEYGEEILACDVDGDGTLDLVAGQQWLRNEGDGTFTPHAIADGFKVARLRTADLTGNGRPDVILGEEVLDFETKVSPPSRLAWFENTGDPASGPWPMHVIDKVRCPHSVDVADLDGDGEPEIICGEHDPFKPYRSRCRLFVYKKADAAGRSWSRTPVDDRFEHHDGTKVIDLGDGRMGIMSHGWTEPRYVHLWQPA